MLSLLASPHSSFFFSFSSFRSLILLPSFSLPPHLLHSLLVLFLILFIFFFLLPCILFKLFFFPHLSHSSHSIPSQGQQSDSLPLHPVAMFETIAFFSAVVKLLSSSPWDLLQLIPLFVKVLYGCVRPISYHTLTVAASFQRQVEHLQVAKPSTFTTPSSHFLHGRCHTHHTPTTGSEPPPARPNIWIVSSDHRENISLFASMIVKPKFNIGEMETASSVS